MCTGDKVERTQGAEDCGGIQDAGGGRSSAGIIDIVNVEISKEVVRIKI